jgi:hypothetical protein
VIGVHDPVGGLTETPSDGLDDGVELGGTRSVGTVADTSDAL